MNTPGARIRARRKQLGLDQTTLAERVGIKQPGLSAIETGETKQMEASTLAGLCRELRLTAEYIMFGAGSEADADLAVAEAELLYILRAIAPERREFLLGQARAVFSPPAPVLPAAIAHEIKRLPPPH